MPTFITPTIQPFAGGVAASAGVGQDTLVSFTGTWKTGDQYTVVLTDGPTGTQTQIGAGFVTTVGEVTLGTPITFAYTYQNKVYILSGPSTFFTSVGSAVIWNDPNGTGNGFVSMSDNYGTPETLQSMAQFQGRMAFFSRNTTQIWSVVENSAQWSQQQVLDNIGTLAGDSVKSVGDFDVFFLSDTGIRSLRVLNISLNAYVDDLGAPIDSLITTALAPLTSTQAAASHAVVEPTRKRYWLFVPNAAGNGGQIFVYSGFRSSKVSAWSTYDPTYSLAGVQTTFVPQNFVIFQGLVFTRDASNLFAYGSPLAANGTAQALYDNVVATIISPYMDMKKPVSKKKSKGVDIVAFGDFTISATDPCQWQVYCSMDPISGTFEQAIIQAGTAALPAATINPTNPAIQATSNSGSFPYTDRGTHFAFKAVSSGTGSAVFSEIIFKYDETPEGN